MMRFLEWCQECEFGIVVKRAEGVSMFTCRSDFGKLLRSRMKNTWHRIPVTGVYFLLLSIWLTRRLMTG